MHVKTSSLSLLLLLFLSSIPSHSYEVSFVKSVVPKTSKLKGVEVGGISGFFRDTQNNLWAVSDDRGAKGPFRFYLMKGSKDDPLQYDFIDHFLLTDKNRKRFAPATLDLEAMTGFSNFFIFASEGDNNQKPRQMPRIFVTDTKGQWHSEIKLPPRFLPEPVGKQTRGILNNGAFEGLSCANACEKLFSIVERPLYQDTDFSNEDLSQPLRLTEWTRDNQSFKVAGEYAYLLDVYQSDSHGKEMFRGASEILSTDSGDLIVLERGVSISTQGLSYRAALYLVSTEGATDIASLQSLKGHKFKPVSKRKIFDFQDIAEQLPEGKIQNFEAMAWGPEIDGAHSLIVGSDNNFSKKEKTLILLLKLKPSAKK